MRTLKLMQHISLDGIIEIGEAGDGYPYGDWTAPYRTPAGRDLVLGAHGESFDLLLGRRTYDIWSGSWPKAPPGPMSNPINAATKYVVTHRPQSLEWGPFQALGDDIIADVRRVKASNGPGLILWGSSTLTSTMLASDLVDEVVLLVYPVLLGKGKRLLAENTLPRAFELASSRALPSGIVMNAFRAPAALKNAT